MFPQAPKGVTPHGVLLLLLSINQNQHKTGVTSQRKQTKEKRRGRRTREKTKHEKRKTSQKKTESPRRQSQIQRAGGRASNAPVQHSSRHRNCKKASNTETAKKQAIPNPKKLVESSALLFSEQTCCLGRLRLTATKPDGKERIEDEEKRGKERKKKKKNWCSTSYFPTWSILPSVITLG